MPTKTGHSFRKNSTLIIDEIRQVCRRIDAAEVDQLVRSIVSASQIVVLGAGRVGLACRGFAMRLGHLGFRAHAWGDATVPSIGSGDLLLVASGSGETKTIYQMAQTAKDHGAELVLVTGRRDSRIGKLADHIVQVPAPSKAAGNPAVRSGQPMTTLNEQSIQILFDSAVLQLMSATCQTADQMWQRHSILE